MRTLIFLLLLSLPAMADEPDKLTSILEHKFTVNANDEEAIRKIFEAKSQGFLEATRDVEKSAVPMGKTPITYPKFWKALTTYRLERYGAAGELTNDDKAERQIYVALNNKLSDIDYNGIPLQQLVTSLMEELNIPIWLNTTALEQNGIDADIPIHLHIPSIKLGSALRIILDPLDLTYIVNNEILEITTKDAARLINKVYPVGNLVVPPRYMRGVPPNMNGGGVLNGAVIGGPVITILPDGTQMTTVGVVSADRRYVRLSISPSFSGIGTVYTFNYWQ